MQQPVWKRLMWLAIIWGGSVLALACVSMLFNALDSHAVVILRPTFLDASPDFAL